MSLRQFIEPFQSSCHSINTCPGRLGYLMCYNILSKKTRSNPLMSSKMHWTLHIFNLVRQ